MIKLWLSTKLRFLSHLACFLSGLLTLVTPWYVFIVILLFALLLDYLAFASEYTSE